MKASKAKACHCDRVPGCEPLTVRTHGNIRNWETCIVGVVTRYQQTRCNSIAPRDVCAITALTYARAGGLARSCAYWPGMAYLYARGLRLQKVAVTSNRLRDCARNMANAHREIARHKSGTNRRLPHETGHNLCTHGKQYIRIYTTRRL